MCSFEIPRLVFYADIPVLVASVLLASIVYISRKHNRFANYLFIFILIFCLWVIVDFYSWFVTDISVMKFLAQVSALTVTALPIFALFSRSFYKKDYSKFQKLLVFLPLLPVAILLFTNFNVRVVDMDICIIEQGGLYYYIYLMALGYVAFITVSLIKYYRSPISKKNLNIRKQIIIILLGLIIFVAWFLVIILLINVLKNIELSWGDELSLLVPVGMLIFVAATVYAIVKYQLLNVKIIATQVLIMVLVLVVGSQFFFVKNPVNIFLTLVTFIFVIVFGYILSRSVSKEIESKNQALLLTDQLKNKNVKLKQLNDMKSEFLSIASHQLRTPLTAIRGLLSMQLEGIFDKETPSKKREIWQKVFNSSTRLSNILDDLLDAMEVEGGIKLTKAKTDLVKVVTEAAEELRPRYQERNLYLRVKKPAKKLPAVKADARYLSQVFMNIINNAEKYTRQGGSTLTFERNPATHTVVVRVKDTGIGINQKDMKKLFQKFSRGEKASLSHTNGSGLGLFIVKKIVDAHGGKVSINSEGEGKGSEFVVELPIT